MDRPIETDEARRFIHAMVRSAVDHLPRDERHVIRELYWSERSRGEIAHQVGASWQTVLRVEQAAIARLRRDLAPVLTFVMASTPRYHRMVKLDGAA